MTYSILLSLAAGILTGVLYAWYKRTQDDD